MTDGEVQRPRRGVVHAAARRAATGGCLALLSSVGWPLGCQAPPVQPLDAADSVASIGWPVPRGWKHETFALPPDFAPDFPYPGTEDLRFMPGFSSPGAPDWWSYEFVWWLDQRPQFDAASLAGALTTYFRGLSTAVGASRFQFDPSRHRAVLAAVPGSAPPRIAGQVFTYDPFETGLPLVLNVEVELRSCAATPRVAIVVALSPRDTRDGVWDELRDAAATWECP